ncbi:MAG: hypothetical protein E6Q84_03350 [Thiothrix sp.]|nr:MAG: hypothetical protein E6Q84_03350 [Thiothrix sp.]
MKEVIRENLSPAQVLEIRKEAKREGATVNVNRIHSQLVEIEIIYPNRVIDVTPKKLLGVA